MTDGRESVPVLQVGAHPSLIAASLSPAASDAYPIASMLLQAARATFAACDFFSCSGASSCEPTRR